MLKEKKDLKLEYTYVGKKNNFLKEFLDLMPHQLKPTSMTVYLYFLIVLIIIGWGIIQGLAPIMDISFNIDNGKMFDMNVRVGKPLVFYETSTEKGIDLNFFNFIINSIIYLFIAYIIEIMIKSLMSLKLFSSKEELKRKPKEVKFKPKNIAEKASDKIIEKTQKTKEQQLNKG